MRPASHDNVRSLKSLLPSGVALVAQAQVSNWEWDIESGFGKFEAEDNSYPFQLWEPDKQADILRFIDMVNKGQSEPDALRARDGMHLGSRGASKP